MCHLCLATSGAAGTGGASATARDVLPTVVKPINYAVSITPNLETCTFTGQAEIDLKVVETTSVITLNANELTISACTLSVVHGGKTETIQTTSKIEFDAKAETVKFTFPSAVNAGATAKIAMDFAGIHNDKMAGFYRSGYKDAQGNKKYMVVTQFEATDCRRCFPSFDEPNLKATFDITLIVSPDRTALSNMNVVSEKEVLVAGQTCKSVTFARTPIMSTYLVAMAVGEFDYIETKAFPKAPKDAQPIDVKVYTLKGQTAQGKFGLEVAAKTLEFFSSYFDIAYPLPKMDLIAIPDFAAGAMENWGLVTYREICLLFDEKTSSAANKQRIAYVVGHELAHQWFGNLVTMDWWAELWLNEGFATFVGWMAVDNLFPEWKVWTQFVTNDYANGLALDGLRSSHPIEVDVKSPSEINQIFDAISYSKGASVIRMLNAFLGQETFMNGVRVYLKKHKFSNATTLDLWAALSEASGKDIATLMYTWTRKMGYPMISVENESYDAGSKTMTLTLSQARYFATGPAEGEKEEDTVWWVPVGVVTHLSPVKPADLILTEKTGTVSFKFDDAKDGYYKLNFGSNGFFRVNLSQPQLKKLGASISKDLTAFGTPDKISVLSDAFALAVAGYGSTTGALEIIKAYEKEQEYNVLEEVDHALSKILSCFYLEAPEISAGVKELKRRIFAPKAKELGYEYPAKEDHLTALKRTLTIRAAAKAGEKSVIEELKTRFKGLIEGDESALHPNLRGTAYVNVLRNSENPSKDFETIAGLSKTAASADQKLSALSALGAVPTPELVDRLLAMVLDPETVKPQDIIYPLGLLGDGPDKAKNLDTLWAWVLKNWSTLHDRYKASLSLLGRVLQAAITSRIGLEFVQTVEDWASGAELKTAEEKAARVESLQTARRPLDQSLEKVKGNTKWVEREREALSAWVKSEQLA